jgi:hypothetical protein
MTTMMAATTVATTTAMTTAMTTASDGLIPASQPELFLKPFEEVNGGSSHGSGTRRTTQLLTHYLIQCQAGQVIMTAFPAFQ